ncbi:MAG: endonuclease domain-containing protein [Hyphomicrobiaceae bacterium]
MANERARRLRREATNAERKLWRYLKDRQLEGHRFRRQHPLGPYIVDFVCLEQMLVIEVDGATHGKAAELALDGERTAWLVERGYRVMRIGNVEIYESIDMVGLAILEALGEYRPAPTE